jgi:hypothetical protein
VTYKFSYIPNNKQHYGNTHATNKTLLRLSYGLDNCISPVLYGMEFLLNFSTFTFSKNIFHDIAQKKITETMVYISPDYIHEENRCHLP